MTNDLPGVEIPDFVTVLPLPGPLHKDPLAVRAAAVARALVVTAAGLAALGCALWFLREPLQIPTTLAAWLCFLLLATAVAVVVASTFRLASHGNSQSREAEPRDVEVEYRGVTRRNQELIARYHDMAHAQASSAFRDSRIAMSVGLVLLVGGAVYVARSDSPAETQVVVGSLAGLGGAFSAYLSATFVRTYNRALDQMSFFFGQPLVMNYLLSAERIITASLHDESREDMLRRIVDSHLLQASQASSAISPQAGPSGGPLAAVRGIPHPAADPRSPVGMNLPRSQESSP